MSTLTLAPGRPTLADRIFARSLATDLVLIASGTALTAIAAQLYIPMWPVPITGQTFAVLLVGTVLGSVRGALSMVLYLVLGAVGLPIFTPQADGSHSGTVIGSPTGGYLLGFIFAAALVGWLAQREWDHKVLRTIVTFVAGTVVIYAFGLPWLYTVLSNVPALEGSDLVPTTLKAGLLPFLIGDTLKALVAGLALPLTWWLVRRADARAADRSE